MSDTGSVRQIAREPLSSAPRDFVFTFSYETWTDARRRGMMRPPDRIVSTLLDSPLVGGLLVANPWRSAPGAVARGILRRNEPFPTSARRGLHQPVRLSRADPLDVDALASEYRAYDRSLRRAAVALGLEAPSVITTNPLVAAFAPFDWAGPVTYFGRDDWLSSPAREQYWPAYREAYRRIAASGRGVTAVSRQIIDRIAPNGPSAVVPNGVEPAEWLAPRPDAPAWFDAIAGPRAVYVGTLDSRLDVDGIAVLAQARPQLQIVLLGPLPDPDHLMPVRDLPNVHVHASVGRSELVATLRNAEVALLAHRRTPLTEAMSPLKVYEYLAAGCPVVSIDLPPVRGLDDRVLLVDHVADFVDAIDDAIAAGRAVEAERVRFVEDNSWASRHRAILTIACRNVSGT